MIERKKAIPSGFRRRICLRIPNTIGHWYYLHGVYSHHQKWTQAALTICAMGTTVLVQLELGDEKEAVSLSASSTSSLISSSRPIRFRCLIRWYQAVQSGEKRSWTSGDRVSPLLEYAFSDKSSSNLCHLSENGAIVGLIALLPIPTGKLACRNDAVSVAVDEFLFSDPNDDFVHGCLLC